MKRRNGNPLKQTGWAILLSLGAASVAHADIAASVRLHAANGSAAITPPVSGLTEGGSTTVKGNLVLTVTCEANVTCTDVSAKLGASSTIDSTAGANGARLFTIEQGGLPPEGVDLTVLYKSKAVKAFNLVPAADAEEVQQASGTTDSLQELLSCDPADVNVPGYVSYDQVNNQAWFVVSPLGTMFNGPNGADGNVVDENDTVKVTLLVHPKLRDYLRVKRTSATRALGGFAVAGEGTELVRFSKVKCEPYTVYLRDFAPGPATVKISAQLGDKETETGNFDFAVSQLFRGILSFGALRSDKLNESFILAPNNGQNVIAPGSEGDKQTSYAVWYTGFVWGRRDLEKPDLKWYHHINPSIGFGTDHPSDNVFVGLTADWNGFLFHVGKHFARETVLSGASGLQVGDPFAGTVDTIPTAKRWTSSTYIAVSIDIRAAASLLKTAVGSK